MPIAAAIKEFLKSMGGIMKGRKEKKAAKKAKAHDTVRLLDADADEQVSGLEPEGVRRHHHTPAAPPPPPLDLAVLYDLGLASPEEDGFLTL